MKTVLVLFFTFSLLFSSSMRYNNHSNIFQSVKKYVLKKYTMKTPKYEFHIEPSSLKLEGNFAMLSAIPLYEDGSDISTEYFEDIVFVLCLGKKEGKWIVIYDLSRNDVPSSEELKDIKKEFPKIFPKKLLPKFWRDRL